MWPNNGLTILAWAFALSAFTVSLVSPWNRRIAWLVGAIDRPDTRKVHRRATPRLGGLSAAVAVLACIGLWLFVDPTAPEQCRRHWGLFPGAAVMLLVGLYDDLFGLGPRAKLLFQIIAAAILWLGGIRIDAVQLPMIGTVELAWVGAVVTILWVVGVTNALNFLDGLDGLAAGTAALASSCFLLIAGFTSLGSLLGLLSAAMIGACVVLVVHNVRPPKSFLGDSGSLLLGVLVASTGILAARNPEGTTRICLPALALTVPLVDMTACVIRRLLVGRSVFAADRGHIHHMLLSFGFRPQTAAGILCGATAVFGLGAVAAARGPAWIEPAMLAAVIALSGVVYRWFGYLSLRMWLHCRRANRILVDLIARTRAGGHATPASQANDGSPETARAVAERLRLVLDGIRRARRTLGIDYILLQRDDGSGQVPLTTAPILELGRKPGTVVTTHLYANERQRAEGLLVTLGEGCSRRPARVHAKELLIMPLLVELARLLGSNGDAAYDRCDDIRSAPSGSMEAALAGD